jgi:hypothetical protein
MSRSLRTCALTGALAAIALVPAAGASPGVSAAGTCHLSSHFQRHSGPSYVTSLSVRHVSCRTGKAVVRSYHKHHGHVSGWSCHRTILDKSPAQYDARVKCSRGAKRVNWTYTQNT